ncbi:hypothetical protein C8R45DRAFT_1149224 [Mycena sanguinolenta]|nr:hypothetical protein C8R45DRAFT_1149224 [Mycena sanguinolenta]
MDPTLTSRHSLVPLNNTLGAWLIGLILSSCVFGVTTLQTYLYYTKYSRRDGLFLKSFVGALIGFDTLHAALLSMSFTNFGDYTGLGLPSWSLLAQIPVAVVLGTMVQLFYAYRIRLLSDKSPIIPGLVALCSLVNLGMSMAYTQKLFHIRDDAARLNIPFSTDSVVPLEAAALGVEMLCDGLISGGMVFSLLRNRSDFGRTNRAINLIVAYTLKSGVLNLTFAICSLISWVASTKTFIYTPFFFVLTRLYSCSFLSMLVLLLVARQDIRLYLFYFPSLNSRDYVRDQITNGGTSHTMLSLPSSQDHVLDQTKSTPSAFRRDSKSYAV